MAAGEGQEHRMTLDGPMSMPPQWAEALLRLLLKRRDRESVSGDLLEQYRDTIVPERGKGADAWYVRQVGWVLWRAASPWAALIAATLTIRGAVDMFLPSHYTAGVVHPRSMIMTNTLLATWVGCGAWNAWRSGRLRSGIFVTFAAASLGALFSTAASLMLLALWHGPQTMAAINGSGGVDEMWGIPLMLIPIGTIWGTVGALAGKGVAVRTDSTLHATWVWAVLLTMAVLARDTLDWRVAPTQDAYARSVVSTWIAVAIFVASGAVTGWRSRSIVGSARAGMTTGILAAVAIDLVTLIQLAIRHDAHTMQMIAASGGLGEAFLLPFAVAVIGTVLAAAGGLFGGLASWSRERFSANLPR
jgi:hypothetical protein